MVFYQFGAFAIVAILLPSLILAKEYVVGDDRGWNASVDYTAWASGKEFHVGDTLVFRYGPPDSVYRVDAKGFERCKPSRKAMSSGSGNDMITLGGERGKRWYVSGVFKNCAQLGQKLLIVVTSDPSIPTDPATPAIKGAFVKQSYGVAKHESVLVVILPGWSRG